jgi:hypothetical protein
MRSEALQALRFFLLSTLPTSVSVVLPADAEIIQGQDNLVPEPLGDNFITMTAMMRDRLGMNVSSYSDGFPGAQVQSIVQPTKFVVQLDIHGPLSQNMAQVITTLFADAYGFEKFAESGFDVRPLFCEQARQMPFVNGEQQVEWRWTVDVTMEAKPAVIVDQQFASELRGGVFSVDALEA